MLDLTSVLQEEYFEMPQVVTSIYGLIVSLSHVNYNRYLLVFHVEILASLDIYLQKGELTAYCQLT